MPTALDWTLLDLTQRQRVKEEEEYIKKEEAFHKVYESLKSDTRKLLVIFDDCGPSGSDSHIPLNEYHKVPIEWNIEFRKLHENVTHAHQEGRCRELMKMLSKGRTSCSWLYGYGYGYGYGYCNKPTSPVVEPKPKHYLSSFSLSVKQENSLTRFLAQYADDLDDTEHHKRALALWSIKIFSESDLYERFKCIRDMHTDLKKLVQLLLQEILPTLPTEYALYAEEDKYDNISEKMKEQFAEVEQFCPDILNEPSPLPPESPPSATFGYSTISDIFILEEAAFLPSSMKPHKRLSQEILAEAIEDLKNPLRLVRDLVVVLRI